MAMELWVLSDKQLNSIAEWQSAIDIEGFPLKLSEKLQFEKLDGFLPSHLSGELTGFECNHWNAGEFVRDASDIDFGHDWKFVLAFRWGGNFNELRAAWIAGAAYAEATGGVVFDDQERKIRSAAEAREVARVEYETPDPNVKSVVDKVLRDLELGPYRET
jgi:hypothetical protein